VNAARSGGIERGVSARVVALLTLAAFINYVDRGNLATAGPLIRDQFALSNAQLGLLLLASSGAMHPASYLPAGSPSGSMRAGFSPWVSLCGVSQLRSPASLVAS
jgi:hypothetical protein